MSIQIMLPHFSGFILIWQNTNPIQFNFPTSSCIMMSVPGEHTQTYTHADLHNHAVWSHFTLLIRNPKWVSNVSGHLCLIFLVYPFCHLR